MSRSNPNTALAAELAKLIEQTEQDWADDANSAEETGERPDLWNYEVSISLEAAKAILTALSPTTAQGAPTPGQAVHRCDEAECCYTGQPSPKECGCHQTTEQVLTAQRDEMLAALRLHQAWSDSEDTGPDYGAQTRDTHPDGERIWRAWWEGNLDLCARAQQATRAAIARATGAA